LGLKDIQGALVTQVVEGSAAAKAGIIAGDIITAVNDRPVKSPSELRNTIRLMRVGDKVNVELLRDGKRQRLTALIADPATVESGPAESPSIHQGLEGATLGDAPNGSGALVRDVAADSPAAQAGLKENDVIVAVNRAKIASLQQLRERAGQGGSSLVLEVHRGKSSVLIPLR
jgi:S1-C subfamily serine protease